MATVKEEHESAELLTLITRFDCLFQIHDSINDLFNTKKMMNKQYIELKSGIMLMVRELSSRTLSLFDNISKSLADGRPSQIAAEDEGLQRKLNVINRELLSLLAHPDREDAGALTNFVTYSRRLKDKLVNFAALDTVEPRHAGEERAAELPAGPGAQA